MLEMDFGRRSASYYEILGVGFDSSAEEIRRAYRKLAMRWHPDKWARNPSLLGEAKLRFQQIQEAYSVLSDQSKRTLYDAGMYDPEEEEEEGFSDFVQEMVTLMAKVKREEKIYTLEELQGMFTEMAKGFESSQCILMHQIVGLLLSILPLSPNIMITQGSQQRKRDGTWELV